MGFDSTGIVARIAAHVATGQSLDSRSSSARTALVTVPRDGSSWCHAIDRRIRRRHRGKKKKTTQLRFSQLQFDSYPKTVGRRTTMTIEKPVPLRAVSSFFERTVDRVKRDFV